MSALATTGAFLGLIHTLAGPDHYVPFIAMARSGRWSLTRTVVITVACGLAHVGSSVVVGMLGILLGWRIATLQWFESARGDLVAWLFIAFGLAYTCWGLRRAWNKRPHSHLHKHADGRAHVHPHTHVGEHAQVHTAEFAPDIAGSGTRVGPWALFLVFVFGPCEPLIPLLMYPAAEQSWHGVVLVTASFAAATLATMVLTVLCGFYGLAWGSLGRLERYDHALAGCALLACGIAMTVGF